VAGTDSGRFYSLKFAFLGLERGLSARSCIVSFFDINLYCPSSSSDDRLTSYYLESSLIFLSSDIFLETVLFIETNASELPLHFFCY